MSVYTIVSAYNDLSRRSEGAEMGLKVSMLAEAVACSLCWAAKMLSPITPALCRLLKVSDDAAALLLLLSWLQLW